MWFSYREHLVCLVPTFTSPLEYRFYKNGIFGPLCNAVFLKPHNWHSITVQHVRGMSTNALG